MKQLCDDCRQIIASVYTIKFYFSRQPHLMSNRNNFLKEQREKLLKAIGHLEYSYKKIQQINPDTTQMDEEDLETWESFSARFCRVADIFLSKYIRTYILAQDPGFIGSFRDFLNQAEKLNLLDDTELWMSIRELRNISAHDYTDKDLALFFKRLQQEAPRLLALKNTLPS